MGAPVRLAFLWDVEGSSRAVAFPTRPRILDVLGTSVLAWSLPVRRWPCPPSSRLLPPSLWAGQTSLPTGAFLTSGQTFVVLTHLMSWGQSWPVCRILSTQQAL